MGDDHNLWKRLDELGKIKLLCGDLKTRKESILVGCYQLSQILLIDQVCCRLIITVAFSQVDIIDELKKRGIHQVATLKSYFVVGFKSEWRALSPSLPLWSLAFLTSSLTAFPPVFWHLCSINFLSPCCLGCALDTFLIAWPRNGKLKYGRKCWWVVTLILIPQNKVD